MKYTSNPERERVLNQALRARTFSEIALANLEMDQWVAAHPDNLGVRDAYEVLANMQVIAEFQKAESRRQEEISRRSPASVG